MKFINYIPENLRYEGAENLETLFTKLVGLFEQVLSGQVSNHYEYLKSVDELYAYWDVIRKPYADKVAKLLDPLNLNELVVEPADKGKFLYFLSDVYSIKGTIKAFRWVLKLVGMDAELIRWYEPEYLNHRPRVEPCRSILKIHVGNKPITEGTVQAFHKLVDLLLDVCFTVALWVYVKDLKDDVATGDLLTFEKPTHYWRDYYASCSMEIIYQGMEGIYGAHTFPQSSYRIGSIWNYTVYRLNDLEYKSLDSCPTLHSGFHKHLDLSNPQNDHNIASLIHIIHPVIRHNTKIIKHNNQYKYDHLIRFSQLVWDCLRHKKTITEEDFGTIEWPRFSGNKQKLTYFTGSPVYYAPCDKEPIAWTISFPFNDRLRITLPANYSISHKGTIVYGKDIYGLLKQKPITFLNDLVKSKHVSYWNVDSFYSDDLFRGPKYNGEQNHLNHESTMIFHGGKVRNEKWKLKSTIFRYDQWKPGVYYLRPNLECQDFIPVKCVPLPRLPNRPLEWNHKGSLFHIGNADYKGYLNGVLITTPVYCPNYHNYKFNHDSVYLHYYKLKVKPKYIHGEYNYHRYTHRFDSIINHGLFYRHELKQTFKDCPKDNVKQIFQEVHKEPVTELFTNVKHLYGEDYFLGPKYNGEQDHLNHESTMIFHGGKVRNEKWSVNIYETLNDGWEDGYYYLKPSESDWNHNTRHKYIFPPTRLIIYHNGQHKHNVTLTVEYHPTLFYNQVITHGTYINYGINRKPVTHSDNWEITSRLSESIQFLEDKSQSIKSSITDKVYKVPIHNGQEIHRIHEGTGILHGRKLFEESMKLKVNQQLNDSWSYDIYHTYPYDTFPSYKKKLYRYNGWQSFTGMTIHGYYEKHGGFKQTIKPSMKNTFSERLVDRFWSSNG